MTLKLFAIGLAMTVAVTACGPSGAKSGEAAPVAAAAGGGAAVAAAGSGAATAPPPQDLLAFASGTLIVVEPADSNDTQLAWSPYNMIDESAASEWMGEFKGPPVFVFELPVKSQIDSIGIDTLANREASAARSIKVEVSDQSESAGFEPLLSANITYADGQTFKAPTPRTGRWVRLTVLTNGGGDYAGLGGVRAYGKALEPPPVLTGLSGTYWGYSGIGKLYLKQEGTRVVGCYEYLDGQISGGVEGRMVKAELRETNGDVMKSLGLLNFKPGGAFMRGFTRNEGNETGFDSFMTAEKKSEDIGDCPKIPGYRSGSAAKSQMETQLATEGRVRLDGVNFDFNSDVIQAASRPLLDQLAALLKSKPDWKVALEGHTDNIGGTAFNRDLSERRAMAVKTYLVRAGAPEDNLTAAGFGYDKPVASNDTVGGRAQNRRVEAVKN
jgi:OOP family OmpA-OmpF porin